MQITKTMTKPSKPGKQPREVWEVTSMAEFEKQLLLSIGGRRWKGAVSFFDDPTEEIESMKAAGKWSPEDALGSRIEHLEGKIEKRQEWAEGRENKSNEAYERSRSLTANIPLGQPILIGHHSERGHRRAIERSHAAMDKCLEHSKMAERHGYVAETHQHTINKLNKSPSYWSNKIKQHRHRINQLKAYQEGRYYIRASAYQGENAQKPSEETIRIYQEQIDAITLELNFAESQLAELMKDRPQSADIQPGDWVFFIQWFEVVKINKKTVTVGRWLCDKIESTYNVPFAKIRKHKKASEMNQQKEAVAS